MYAPRPIITLLDTPAEILSLDLIKEFIGLDPDIDAGQDRALPVLLQAAIDQGQQITGIVWAQAHYRVAGLYAVGLGARIILPLAPVFEVVEVVGKNGSGTDVPVPAESYSVIPSGIEFGRPWAEIWPLSTWPEDSLTFSVVCIAGWEESNLPKSIESWMLNRISTLYDLREDVSIGAIAAALPRDHTRGLLDRWTVRGTPHD